jgi:hypothetical protein
MPFPAACLRPYTPSGASQQPRAPHTPQQEFSGGAFYRRVSEKITGSPDIVQQIAEQTVDLGGVGQAKGKHDPRRRIWLVVGISLGVAVSCGVALLVLGLATRRQRLAAMAAAAGAGAGKAAKGPVGEGREGVPHTPSVEPDSAPSLHPDPRAGATLD